MHKKLKVLQVIDSLAVGGAEMMAVNISNGLFNYNVESHLCVTRAEGLLKEKINKEVGYLFLRKQGIIDVKAVFKLRKYIKKYQISIIHAHSSSFFIAVLVKLIYPKVKIVWHDHYGKAEEIKKRKSVALKLASFFFSSIVVVNKILLEWSQKYLYQKKVQFIANFASLKSLVKTTILKGNINKKIVCVAAFRPQKDHDNLLEAFFIVKNKYPDWTLHLIGQKREDLYTHQIEEKINNKDLQDHVFFYGSCLDIEHVLIQADIGVLSSNSEGLPVSLLEYGLAGLPVVVTNVGECKKVIKNYGIVIPKEDEIALANAILKYIEDEKLRELNAKQFQKHIFDNYSEDSYFSQLLNIYKEC